MDAPAGQGPTVKPLAAAEPKPPHSGDCGCGSHGHVADYREFVDGWRTALGGDPVPWLLEAEDPALRAATPRHLLDRPPDDAELAAARVAMADEGVVGRILAAQGPDGHWGEQTFNDRFRVRVEVKGKPSRWLTLEALRMLKAA